MRKKERAAIVIERLKKEYPGADCTLDYNEAVSYTHLDVYKRQPVYVAQCFMTMCVSALALTSLDAVARIGRMSFQELFSVDDMTHAEGWRKLLCNTYFSTIVTLLAAFILTRIGYANIWPLFGSANQLLSALVLVTLCVFLKVTGRSNKMLFPPLIIMLCVTGTALVERTISLVQAFSAGTATFLVEGLQLILSLIHI